MQKQSDTCMLNYIISTTDAPLSDVSLGSPQLLIIALVYQRKV